MSLLAQTSTSIWTDSRFVLIALAIIIVLVLLWATSLRARLMKAVTQQADQSRRDVEIEHLYAELVEHASDVILRLDRNGQILAINKSGAQMLGYSPEQLIGKNITSFMASGVQQTVAVEGSKEYSMADMVLRDRFGEPVHLEMSLHRERVDGQTRSAEIIARNITERRRFETQMRQNERMQAMGLLAGGVAHDFNNYLTVILNFADLAIESQPNDEVKQMLTEIRKAGLLASEMSRHMIDFSRRQAQPPSHLDLNTVIVDLKRMLHSALGRQIELKLQLATGLPPVLADMGSLEQMLINLVLNARDALNDTGKVTIRTLPGQINKNVILEVSDTGSGIDPADKARVFQPFFTTKAESKGTGLGLASVQRIMLKLGGSIDVESTPGQGATFRLVFPIASVK